MTPEELRILSWTLLGEAAGESDLGLKAVAHVIRNRAESGRFPSNPAAVAIQNNGRYYQFSAWNAPWDGGNSPRARYPVGSEQFNRAARIVTQVFGPTPGNDPTRGATHYYSPQGMPGGNAPYWWNSEARWGEEQIGNHVFAVRNSGPVPPSMPTPRNYLDDIGPGATFAGVQTFRTGYDTRLPELPASGAANPANRFEYDPVRNAIVPIGQSAQRLAETRGSAREAQRERSIVAGFSVPGTARDIYNLDRSPPVMYQELRDQGMSYAAQDRARPNTGPAGAPKPQDRLPATGPLPAPRFGGGALSRDSLAAAAAGRAAVEAGVLKGRNVPLPQRRPERFRDVPLPRPRIQPPPPPQPTLRVIVEGGNYSTSARQSAGSGLEMVRTQTGKVVPSGMEYRGSDGYVYRVESNGSITNLTSGSNSGRSGGDSGGTRGSWNSETGQVEWH